MFAGVNAATLLFMRNDPKSAIGVNFILMYRVLENIIYEMSDVSEFMCYFRCVKRTRMIK